MQLSELDTAELAAFTRKAVASGVGLDLVTELVNSDKTQPWTFEVVLASLESMLDETPGQPALVNLFQLVKATGQKRLLDAVFQLARVTACQTTKQLCAAALAAAGQMEESFILWSELAVHPRASSSAVCAAIKSGSTPAQIERLLVAAMQQAALDPDMDICTTLSLVDERRPGAIVRNALKAAQAEPWWQTVRKQLADAGYERKLLEVNND